MRDNSRTGSCDEKVKGVTIIMSWEVNVLGEMEIVENARKFVRSRKVRISMDIEVTTENEFRW